MGSGDDRYGDLSCLKWTASTLPRALARVPVPWICVQLADVRSTMNSAQDCEGGMNPTLYCHTLGLAVNSSLPIPKWISSGWLTPTSSSHTRTWVMPAAVQLAAYSGPVERVP